MRMSTIMQILGRRCDAKCYMAKGDICDCICMGEFHGQGGLIQDDFEVVEAVVHDAVKQDWARVRAREAQFDLFGNSILMKVVR